MKGVAQILARQRPEIDPRVGDRVPKALFTHEFDHPLRELLGHPCNHDEALGSDARLPTVQES